MFRTCQVRVTVLVTVLHTYVLYVFKISKARVCFNFLVSGFDRLLYSEMFEIARTVVPLKFRKLRKYFTQ